MTEPILNLAISLLVAAFAMFVIENYVPPKRGLRYIMIPMVIMGECAWLLRASGISWPAFGLLAKIMLTIVVSGILLWAVNGNIARHHGLLAVVNVGVLLAISLFLMQIFAI